MASATQTRAMRRLAHLGLVMLAAAASAGAAGDPAAAKQILATAGVHGGLVVHLGCGDGRLTATLRPTASYCVHGLDTDAAQVAKAREHIRSLGLYGSVAVDTFDGSRLPYVDSTVNLVVASVKGQVSSEEIARVLAPRGKALIPAGSSLDTRPGRGRPALTLDTRSPAGLKGWTLFPKPVPQETDEWTHYLHDADNNAVANDTAVGPPRRLQWQSGPKWTRHHDKMSSVSALVSQGGRIFYIFDEGSSASIYLPSRWALLARDAFNGKLLWRRPIKTWYSRFKGLKDGPADAPRRLVAVDGRVYATLDLRGPVTCLDAATGETIREYANTKEAEEVVLSDGVLFVLTGPGSIGDGRRLTRPVEKRTILALDAKSGKKLWQHTDVVAAMTMAVDDARLYYFNFASTHLIGLDRKTGQKLWTSEALPTPAKQTSFFASKLVVSDGVVLFASGEVSGMIKSTGGASNDDTLTAVSATTGKTLWQAKHPPSGYSSPENVFVIGGTVWCDNSSNGRSDGTVVAYDLRTGRQKQKFPSDQKSYWFHHRCYPGRATTNYIITSRTGMEFIDFRAKKWDLNHWARGACLYGILPANGLIYTPPAPCICYAETYLHSFNAYAPAGRDEGSGARDEPKTPRLDRGPAYGSSLDTRHSTLDTSAEWPTYRGGNARRGASKTRVPAKLAAAWDTKLGGKLSSVVVAEGKVFVAAVDAHTVHALDAASGKRLWHYTAGGRVDSPPTITQGRVLFGSADGRVYCLRSSDGALIWRFRAAPIDRRILSYEQIESLWPVHGNVMVRNGIAHFVAGRSIFVDGGMRFYRLDAKTGKVVSETVLDERNPKTGKNVQELIKWLNMPVGRPDILSCDGKRIYMRSQAFDLEGKRLAMGPTASGPQEGQSQGGEGTHLFCPTGFLDDTWFHRTYWLYGRTWGSGWNGYYVAGKFAPAGRTIAVGDDQVYVFGRRPEYYRWTAPLEYRLFAAHKEWKAAPRTPADRRTAKEPAPKKGKKGRPKGGPTPVTNQANYAWSTEVPVLVRAMTLAGGPGPSGAEGTLFIAGPRDVLNERALGRASAGNEKVLLEQEAALAGRAGAVLWAVSAADGRKMAELALDSPPVFDGMAAAGGKLYLSAMDGSVRCLGPAQ